MNSRIRSTVNSIEYLIRKNQEEWCAQFVAMEERRSNDVLSIAINQRNISSAINSICVKDYDIYINDEIMVGSVSNAYEDEIKKLKRQVKELQEIIYRQEL
jgi:hypothetical protein